LSFLEKAKTMSQSIWDLIISSMLLFSIIL
jgi:hypothetical protein